MYNEKVLSIFSNPQNMGRLKNADMVGKAGEVEDGDVVKLYFKLQKDIIKQATFETFGCVSAIVCSSVLTELVIDKSIEQALKLKVEDIVAVVDQLPVGKEHGAELALKALAQAVDNYYKELFKAGKIKEDEYNKLTHKEKPKKVTKKEPKKAKKVKKVVKVVEVKKEEPKVEEKPEEKKELHNVSKLMLLTKKITTTTTKNTTK